MYKTPNKKNYKFAEHYHEDDNWITTRVMHWEQKKTHFAEFAYNTTHIVQKLTKLSTQHFNTKPYLHVLLRKHLRGFHSPS